MTQWTVCPACGLRHSRVRDNCPRCRSRTPGNQAGPATSSAAAAVSRSAAAGEPARRASRRRRLWAILALVGLAVLGAVVRRGARYAGREAMGHVHWRDPALLKAEENLERDLLMLRTMAQSLEAYRATAVEDDRALKARSAVLERAVRGLDGVSAAAGLELEERLPARKNGSWTTTSVRVRAGRDPSELIDVVARLPLPEGAWVEAARCVAPGCSLVLSAATWKEPQRPPTVMQPRPLPPRPWWPPSGEVWDRVHEANEEYARLGTRVNELYALKQVREAGTLLEIVTIAARNEKHRTAIAGAVGAALAAGMTEVEVRRVANGMHVSVPQRSADLMLRLGDLGRVWEERSSGSATTFGLAFGRGQLQLVFRDTDLPVGFSAGF